MLIKFVKKQLATSSLFVVLTVGVFGYGFYWFTNSVRIGALEVGVLLMFVSVIGYISTSMARVVEDSSLSIDNPHHLARRYDQHSRVG